MPRYNFYITAKRLRANGACEPHVQRFVEVFGEGRVFFTERNLTRAIASELPLAWLAFTYLSLEEYFEATDSKLGRVSQAERYFEAVKAKMAKDRKKRPPEWF